MPGSDGLVSVARAGRKARFQAIPISNEPQAQMLFETLRWGGRPLPELPFYVMGQVCVAKAYRGQGVFDALYHGHRTEYGGRFDLLVTEIATHNTRSLRAHERVGFVPLHQYTDSIDEWVIVGWDWREPAAPL